ncbi:MAG: enoyl-CoA hydratase [Actinomycetia bacterium]|nr:enoyl-CoA hydratase [Actinomycetes bacterium]MCP4959845.1 enoyl-CoA hydratase [Actinomycetes bacterium]
MPVLTRTEGPICIITLDREAKRNAINAEMTESIDAALNEFEDDDTLRVAIVTGGPNVFCAGTDIAEGSGTPTKRGGLYGIIERHASKPVIAAVEGMALGGGFEIALSCDLIVAASDARFGLPEVRRGLVATSSGMFRAPRALPLNVARELLLTGDPIDAERAEGLGLVNRLAEPGGAVDAAIELAERIILNAPTSIGQTLGVIDAIYTDADGKGWDATRSALKVIVASEDRHEGVKAFFEKRVPIWPGR